MKQKLSLPRLTQKNLESVGIYGKKIDKKELRKGALIEHAEHKTFPFLVAVKIAYDHIKEDKHYYKKK